MLFPLARFADLANRSPFNEKSCGLRFMFMNSPRLNGTILPYDCMAENEEQRRAGHPADDADLFISGKAASAHARQTASSQEKNTMTPPSEQERSSR